MLKNSLLLSTRIKLLGLVITTMACSSLRADFISIAQPNQAYVNSTTLLDFSDQEGTLTGGIAGGGEILIYSSNLVEYKVPSWKKWNTPPAVETATPNVGFSNGSSSLLIGLSVPASTFGLEIEPDNQSKERIVASFYSGSTIVGTIDLSPDGNGGALLFAASTTTSPFTSIAISDMDGGDFAIARQRFKLAAVPEPGSLLLFAVALLPLTANFIRKTSRTR